MHYTLGLTGLPAQRSGQVSVRHGHSARNFANLATPCTDRAPSNLALCCSNMLPGQILQNSGALPPLACDSSRFRWRARTAPRQLCITAGVSAPPETARQQQKAVANIPVQQAAAAQDAQPNPVMTYLTSAISGISQLWMQQGSKAASAKLLEETAQRAAEVSAAHLSFAAPSLLMVHIPRGRCAAACIAVTLALSCLITETHLPVYSDRAAIAQRLCYVVLISFWSRAPASLTTSPLGHNAPYSAYRLQQAATTRPCQLWSSTANF